MREVFHACEFECLYSILTSFAVWFLIRNVSKFAQTRDVCLGQFVLLGTNDYQGLIPVIWLKAAINGGRRCNIGCYLSLRPIREQSDVEKIIPIIATPLPFGFIKLRTVVEPNLK